MFKITPEIEDGTLHTGHLKEGQIALIQYPSNEKQIVYAYRNIAKDPISIVSLTKLTCVWDDAAKAELPVIRIFKSGDVLEIA